MVPLARAIATIATRRASAGKGRQGVSTKRGLLGESSGIATPPPPGADFNALRFLSSLARRRNLLLLRKIESRQRKSGHAFQRDQIPLFESVRVIGE